MSWHLCVPTGRSWGSEDFAKEVDVLPENKNGLPGAGFPAAVRYPGFIPLVCFQAAMEDLHFLRHLYSTVVRLDRQTCLC